MGGIHLPGAEAAHRMEPTDVHPPRDIHHRVLRRVQAHGDCTRARHHDPLRAGHARARHGLRKDVRPPTVEQALRRLFIIEGVVGV